MKILKLRRNLTNVEYGNKRFFSVFYCRKLNQINKISAKILFEFAMRDHLYSNAPVSVWGLGLKFNQKN